MTEKEIFVLQKQIEKLNDLKFNLNVWKNTTILVLERVFGRDSGKIDLIKNINYEYSSWTMRDTSGIPASETVKRLGREILETAIQEIEVFGLPEIKSDANINISVIKSALENTLRISQYRELMAIISETKDRTDRKKLLAEKLQAFGDESVRSILADILSHPDIENID
jgi:hypothetical protein